MGKAKSQGSGTRQSPWVLKTPPGTSDFDAYRDEAADPPALVVQVGKTEERYQRRGAGRWAGRRRVRARPRAGRDQHSVEAARREDGGGPRSKAARARLLQRLRLRPLPAGRVAARDPGIHERDRLRPRQVGVVRGEPASRRQGRGGNLDR